MPGTQNKAEIFPPLLLAVTQTPPKECDFDRYSFTGSEISYKENQVEISQLLSLRLTFSF